jgi:hypothetical protein
MNALSNRNAVGLALILVAALGLSSWRLGSGRELEPQAATPSAAAATQDGSSAVIDNDSELPDTSPHTPYEVRFRAHGGVGAQHWRIEKGALPPGMKLEDDGFLHGAAERVGEFQFTLSVTDARSRETGVQKGFVIRVRSALTLNWKNEARVNGNRIEGSVEVTNTTPDDIDLTYYVLAVAENGRATAIGYQRFLLRRSTLPTELPFGQTLPHGGYVVHVDAVGEVAAKKVIYRENLQTPAPLQVVVGP